LIFAINYVFSIYLPAQTDTAAGIGFARAVIVMVGGIVGVALFTALVLAWIFATRWTRPQRALYAISAAVAEGNFEGDFEETGPIETRLTVRNLGRIARSFDRLETARRTWLVGISQELRKPVLALCDQLASIHQRGEPVSTSEIVDLGNDVQRLVEMAEDLHAVALADLGRLPVNFTQIDPCALIHNAIWANKRKAESGRVQLITGIMPESTVIVRWDSARIEQLFGALIENSLRYTPPGGRIELGLEGARNAWRLIIDDTAPGIDVELAQQLFEPFYRTTHGEGETGTSSGLGLATAQAIVEAHHGRIESSRSPIGGLRVTVILPANPPTA
jgi:two-component system sensor histidine kinase BaeS